MPRGQSTGKELRSITIEIRQSNWLEMLTTGRTTQTNGKASRPYRTANTISAVSSSFVH
jgi:hypothetical protein